MAIKKNKIRKNRLLIGLILMILVNVSNLTKNMSAGKGKVDTHLKSHKGICAYTESVKIQSTRIETYVNKEPSDAQCPILTINNDCQFTKQIKRSRFIDSYDMINRTNYRCCNNYKLSIVHQSNDINITNCTPICVPPCEFGICVRPGKCECLAGFMPSYGETSSCIPKCKPECKHGKCILPGQCQCDDGYYWNEQYKNCLPVCIDGCIPHSKCTAPTLCLCDPGYHLNITAHECQRVCSSGYFYNPDTRRCLKMDVCPMGFYFSYTNRGCLSKCKNPKFEWNRIATKCLPTYCKFGYRLTAHSGCQPLCKNCTLNPHCARPNHCELWMPIVEQTLEAPPMMGTEFTMTTPINNLIKRQRTLTTRKPKSTTRTTTATTTATTTTTAAPKPFFIDCPNFEKLCKNRFELVQHFNFNNCKCQRDYRLKLSPVDKCFKCEPRCKSLWLQLDGFDTDYSIYFNDNDNKMVIHGSSNELPLYGRVDEKLADKKTATHNNNNDNDDDANDAKEKYYDYDKDLDTDDYDDDYDDDDYDAFAECDDEDDDCDDKDFDGDLQDNDDEDNNDQFDDYIVDECINGNCISPGICICNDGYRKVAHKRFECMEMGNNSHGLLLQPGLPDPNNETGIIKDGDHRLKYDNHIKHQVYILFILIIILVSVWGTIFILFNIA